MERFCTYEHPDNCYEPAAMTQAEFDAGGHFIIETAGDYVWQWAPDAATAVLRHVAKHDEWAEDVASGRPEKTAY